MSKINNLKAGVSKVKEHAFEINEFTINTADDVVDVVLKNSREWQKLFGKVVKNGSKLLWKQQDLAMSALENVSDQLVDNNQKLAEFLEVDNFLSVVKSAVKRTSPKAEAEGKKKAKVKTAFPTKKVIKVKTIKKAKASKAEKKGKKAVKQAKRVTKKIVLKGTKSAKSAVKKGAKATKVATVKANKAATKATKKAASTATKVERKVVRTIRKDNLQDIKGIGEKTASLLNNAGIYSFDQLAKASKKTLTTVLENAGPRFANFDPTEWTKQATTLAAKAKKA